MRVCVGKRVATGERSENAKGAVPRAGRRSFVLSLGMFARLVPWCARLAVAASIAAASAAPAPARYRIAEAHYRRSRDKPAAIRDILAATDIRRFLERSGYSP